jgi:hypothetical protein
MMKAPDLEIEAIAIGGHWDRQKIALRPPIDHKAYVEPKRHPLIDPASFEPVGRTTYVRETYRLEEVGVLIEGEYVRRRFWVHLNLSNEQALLRALDGYGRPHDPSA